MMPTKTYGWTRPEGIVTDWGPARAVFAKLAPGMTTSLSYCGVAGDVVVEADRPPGGLSWAGSRGAILRCVDGLPGPGVDAVSFTVDEPDPDPDPTDALDKLVDVIGAFMRNNYSTEVKSTFESYRDATEGRTWKLAEVLDRAAIDKLGRIPEGAVLLLTGDKEGADTATCSLTPDLLLFDLSPMWTHGYLLRGVA